jgi:hypothetical protein
MARLLIATISVAGFRLKTSRGLFGIVLLFGLARFVEPAHGHSGGWGFLRRHAGEPATPPPAKPVVVIKDPFFCYPHNLGFRTEADFLEHLRTTHHVSSEHSPAHLLRIDERWSSSASDVSFSNDATSRTSRHAVIANATSAMERRARAHFFGVGVACGMGVGVAGAGWQLLRLVLAMPLQFSPAGHSACVVQSGRH